MAKSSRRPVRQQLEPYLGLHYPATDVPPQARRIYLRQSVGAIADSSYKPVPLLADPALDDGYGARSDLQRRSAASRRAIVEFMRNMGTAASLTIGLAQGPDLWGMLVCHHGTPRIAGPELRAVAEMIGQVVSLLLGSLGESEVYAQRFERIATLRALVDRLAAPDAAGRGVRRGGGRSALVWWRRQGRWCACPARLFASGAPRRYPRPSARSRCCSPKPAARCWRSMISACAIPNSPAAPATAAARCCCRLRRTRTMRSCGSGRSCPGPSPGAAIRPSTSPSTR